MDHIDMIKNEMKTAAPKASFFYFSNKLRSKDSYPHGDAWVEIVPKHAVETLLGKNERSELSRLGFKPSKNGRKFLLDNPGGIDCNNVNVKIAGASAVSAILSYHGFRASVNHQRG